jgi:hypothetical protein
MGSFEKFLEIVLNHSYFAPALFNKFSVVVSPSTRKNMSSNSILMKRNENQFVFLREKKQEQDLYKGRLIYYIYSDDPYFVNYTDLSLNYTDRALYLCNAVDRQFWLSAEKEISDMDLIEVRNSSFEYKSEEIDTTSKIELKNNSKEVLISFFGNEGTVRVDLSLEEEGKYFLYINGKNVLIFFYLKKMPIEGLIGIVDLDLATLQGTIENFRYEASFVARKTIWRYWLSMDPVKDGDLLNIKDEKNQIKFIGKEKNIKGPDGNNYCVFESDTNLALKNRAENLFSLNSIVNGYEKTLIKRLSAPTAEQIKPVQNTNKYISEIFIHL